MTVPLPEPKKYFGIDAEPDFSYYTETQMRAYAADVSAALREVVESTAAADEFKDSPGAMERLAKMARAALETAEAAVPRVATVF